MKYSYTEELSGRPIYTLYHSSKRQSSARYRSHHHTDAEFSFILNGSGEYLLNGVSYPFRAGDLFVIRSNEQHCLPIVHSARVDFLNLRFSPYYFWNGCSDYIPSGSLSALVDSDISIRQCLRSDAVAAQFQKLRALFETSPAENAFSIRFEVLQTVILTASLIGETAHGEMPTLKRLDDIQNAISYIRLNYHRPITLGDIARHAAMSRSYLSGTFKAITGMSPYNYLITTRIESALELLRHSRKTVLSISLDCGFTPLTAFNKAFKQLTGLTPTEFRNRK